MSSVKFIYVRDKAELNGRGFPVGCFAYKVTFSKTEQILSYGYSVYNPTDVFSKRAARTVAEYRLLMEPLHVRGHLNEHINDLLSEAMVNEQSESPYWDGPLPRRFRNACLRMGNQLKESSPKTKTKTDSWKDSVLRTFGLGKVS